MGAELFEKGEKIEDGSEKPLALPFRVVAALVRIVVDRPVLFAAILIVWFSLGRTFASGWVGAVFWTVIVVGTVALLVKFWGRQERWARRRQFVRRWIGRPGHPGLAYELGMVTRSGLGPRVCRYRDDGQAVRIDFENPHGLQESAFEAAGTVLAENLGGYAVETDRVRPGVVRVKIVLEDALMQARQTGLLPDSVGDSTHDQDFRDVRDRSSEILSAVESDTPWWDEDDSEEMK